MFDPYLNVVHLSDGRLGQQHSTREPLSSLVTAALTANMPSGLVINFHGGLVSEDSARETAERRQYPCYDGAGAYPVFFVWESGFFEAQLNNLGEIAKEAFFQEILKKAVEWLAKRFDLPVRLPGAGSTTRSATGSVDVLALRQELDAWFAGDRDQPPVGDTKSTNSPAGNTRNAEPDAEVLTYEVEESLHEDDKFKEVIEAVAASLQAPQPGAATKGVRVATTSLLSQEAATRLFGKPPSGTTKGVFGIEWFRVAKAIVAIVVRVARRHRSGRDHGGYVTVVEEVLRELYIDKIGQVGWWDRMKADTEQACQDGDDRGATVLLQELHRQIDDSTPPRITLVGHSTGAIFICHFLRAAARHAPQLEFDIVFQAPAVTYDLFAATLAEHGSRIRHFRQFTMSDALERADVLVPILYTSSLLYFISGMLEKDFDKPLVGMQRYFTDRRIYPDAQFANLEPVREFFKKHTNGLVWSPATGGNGLNSSGDKHGSFDDEDQATLASMAWLLQEGF